MRIWTMLLPYISPEDVSDDAGHETAGLNLANLKGKIESLQILTTQKRI